MDQNVAKDFVLIDGASMTYGDIAQFVPVSWHDGNPTISSQDIADISCILAKASHGRVYDHAGILRFINRWCQVPACKGMYTAADGRRPAVRPSVYQVTSRGYEFLIANLGVHMPPETVGIIRLAYARAEPGWSGEDRSLLSDLAVLIHGRPLKSCAAAQSDGSKRYFTGKPCRNNHYAERETVSHKCLQCHEETSDPEADAIISGIKCQVIDRPQPRIIMMMPDMAKALLKKNTDNRPTRRSFVEYLKERLRSGNWQLDVQAIALRDDDVLGNGQHRLVAISEAGIAAEVMYVEGVTKEECDVYDQGLRRTQSDIFRIPQGLAADVALIAQIMGRTVLSRVTTEITRDIIPWWQPVYQVLGGGDVKRENRRGVIKGTNAYLRVGAGLQWSMQTTDVGRAYVLGQVNALRSNRVEGMSTATFTLLRNLLPKGLKTSDTRVRIESTLRTYHFLRPNRAQIAPQLSHPDVVLTEVKRAITNLEAQYVARAAARP